MNKLLLVSFLITLFFACSQEPSEEEKAQQAAAQARADEKAADEALLEKARSLFKALPAVATNPANPVSNEKVELGTKKWNWDICCILIHDFHLPGKTPVIPVTI